MMEDYEQRIRACLKNEDHKEDWFRSIIFAEQIGDIFRYIAHDEKINPGARPYKSTDDEKMAYGQAIIQLMACAFSRGFTLRDCVEPAMKQWEYADWRKVKRIQNEQWITGISANPGVKVGRAVFVRNEQDLNKVNVGDIIIATDLSGDLTSVVTKAAAIVTDQGGLLCHAAIVARERNVPCIVGVGNATTEIKEGEIVTVDANAGKVVRFISKPITVPGQ